MDRNQGLPDEWSWAGNIDQYNYDVGRSQGSINESPPLFNQPSGGVPLPPTYHRRDQSSNSIDLAMPPSMTRADSVDLNMCTGQQQRTFPGRLTSTRAPLSTSAALVGPMSFWDQEPISNRLFEAEASFGKTPAQWLAEQGSDPVAMPTVAQPVDLQLMVPGPSSESQFQLASRHTLAEDVASLYSESSYRSGNPGVDQPATSPSIARPGMGLAVDTPPTSMTRESSGWGSSVYGGLGMLRVSSTTRSDVPYHRRHSSSGSTQTPALLRTLSTDAPYGGRAHDTQQIGSRFENRPAQSLHPPPYGWPAAPLGMAPGPLETVAEDMIRSKSNDSMQSTSSHRSTRSFQAHVANGKRQKIRPRGRAGASPGRIIAGQRRKTKTRGKPGRPSLKSKSSTRSYCDVCGESFRAEHERHRHEETQHGQGKTWICHDMSPNGLLLANCKRCSQGKIYHTDYGAAAHLRRIHFNTDGKTRGRGSKGTAGRGGNSGGKEPPLGQLRDEGWVREAVATAARNAGDGDERVGNAVVDSAVAGEYKSDDANNQQEDEAIEQRQTLSNTPYPQGDQSSQPPTTPYFKSSYTPFNDLPPLAWSPPSFASPPMMHRDWSALSAPPVISPMTTDPPQTTGFDPAQPAMGRGSGIDPTDDDPLGIMASQQQHFIIPATNNVDHQQQQGNPPTTVDPNYLNLPSQEPLQYSAFLAGGQESAVPTTGSSQLDDLMFPDYTFDESFPYGED
ncbi:MAG: hypothetical protein M1823_003530 [Watsoniomyces obsoletus]|nr:MAG: hypothetical protein M1823_003530 [Watsoniomyces obsoletus]